MVIALSAARNLFLKIQHNRKKKKTQTSGIEHANRINKKGTHHSSVPYCGVKSFFFSFSRIRCSCIGVLFAFISVCLHQESFPDVIRMVLGVDGFAFSTLDYLPLSCSSLPKHCMRHSSLDTKLLRFPPQPENTNGRHDCVFC